MDSQVIRVLSRDCICGSEFCVEITRNQSSTSRETVVQLHMPSPGLDTSGLSSKIGAGTSHLWRLIHVYTGSLQHITGHVQWRTQALEAEGSDIHVTHSGVWVRFPLGVLGPLKDIYQMTSFSQVDINECLTVPLAQAHTSHTLVLGMWTGWN